MRKRTLLTVALSIWIMLAGFGVIIEAAPNASDEIVPMWDTKWGVVQLNGFIFDPAGNPIGGTETEASFEIIISFNDDGDDLYWPEVPGELGAYESYSDQGIYGFHPVDDSNIPFDYYVKDFQVGEPGDHGRDFKIWVNGSKMNYPGLGDGWCTDAATGTVSTFTFPSSGYSMSLDIRIPGELYEENTTMNLTQGWNLVSFPVEQPRLEGVPINHASDVGNVTNCSMLSWWNADGQAFVSYIPGFNLPTDPENFEIGENDGFFVWMDGNATYLVEGYGSWSSSVSLIPGWNMVGYKSLALGDVGTMWAGQVSYGSYDDICWYDGQTYVHYIFPGTEMLLVPTRGYFVWSDTDTWLLY